MPSKEKVIREIEQFEGFIVRMQPLDETKGAKPLKSYIRSHGRIARQSFNVADWKRRRFHPLYPNHNVEVLLANGKPASARTTLAKIRATYGSMH